MVVDRHHIPRFASLTCLYMCLSGNIGLSGFTVSAVPKMCHPDKVQFGVWLLVIDSVIVGSVVAYRLEEVAMPFSVGEVAEKRA